MSSKVDNVDVAVPEASPDSNEEKQAAAESKPTGSRKKLWIAGSVLLLVVAIIAIVVPLATKDDNKDTSNSVTIESAGATQMGSNLAHQCFPPTENDQCNTKESYEKCLGLANRGCKTIYSTFSCPPMHRCGDESAQQLPEHLPETPPMACTMELRHCADGTGVGRSGPNCQFEKCSDGSCPNDSFLCDSGVEILRDPALGCEFETCPPPDACLLDMKSCPDGSSVGRFGPECEFAACPGEAAEQLGLATPEHLPETPPTMCTLELRPCADGTSVGRSGPNCEFAACPGESAVQLPETPPVACTLEVRPCADGTSVGRSGPNCEFAACPGESAVQLPETPPVACTLEVRPCADGTSVGRSGPNCEFAACPGVSAVQLPEMPPMACTLELRTCADGTGVGRSGPNCQFEKCPDGSCPIDSFLCDSGVELLRDPALGCEFEACPPRMACTLELRPCADGTSVGRSGPNCDFAACPGESAEQLLVACTMDVKPCGDGSFVSREGPNCEFKICPEELNLRCTREITHCTDGTPVGRAPPACIFEACSDGSCPVDTFLCDSGVELQRDPNMYCEFPACPSP